MIGTAIVSQKMTCHTFTVSPFSSFYTFPLPLQQYPLNLWDSAKVLQRAKETPFFLFSVPCVSISHCLQNNSLTNRSLQSMGMIIYSECGLMLCQSSMNNRINFHLGARTSHPLDFCVGLQYQVWISVYGVVLKSNKNRYYMIKVMPILHMAVWYQNL